MKKKFMIILLTALLPQMSYAVASEPELVAEKLTSPDGNYVFSFLQNLLPDGRRAMTYSITYRGKNIIEPSKMGVEIENKTFESALGVPHDSCTSWCDNLNLIRAERTQQDTVWHPAYGEWSAIRDKYNALTLKFMKGSNKSNGEPFDKVKCYYLNIEVRAYDEGVAFRYTFPETGNGLFLHLTDELTTFRFEPGAEAWHAAWAQGPYTRVPLKGWKDEAERPLTIKLQNGLYVSLLEAEMVDYARTKFRLVGDNMLKAQIYSSVDVITPFATSWRTVMACEKAVDLINHDYLILNLNEPCKLNDTSWLKPGKVFRCCRLTQKDALEAVDFAAERGLQDILFDSHWYGPEMEMSSSALAVDKSKDLNISKVVKYAKSKGIGLLLYVNQRALYQQLDSILPLYEQWGVKGIKFGFVQVGNQMWSRWLHDAVKKCAEHHLMVDIHDEYRPTGFSRTYPNLMTQEGVRGNEEMPDATHNVVLPFTRFIAGPADYTLCYYNKRVKNTHAHQLAMAVVYYSPLTWMFWYDVPKDCHGEPELEFWKDVPTVWDETRALQGEPGEYIVTARRSNNDWYLGAMTNTEPRTVNIKCDFLQKRHKYIAHLYEDDANVKTATHVACKTLEVNKNKEITLNLQSSGGAAIRFEMIK
jgi:alpha-glucosidase